MYANTKQIWLLTPSGSPNQQLTHAQLDMEAGSQLDARVGQVEPKSEQGGTE